VIWACPESGRRPGRFHEGEVGLLRVAVVGSRTCKVTVGLASDQGIRVQYQEIRRTETDICGLATAVAEGIVTNLESSPPS